MEIDCWDAPKGPKVTHGHTFCTVEQFSEVAKAISECAFVTSELPVILSLEMHCSPEQQEVLADICVDVLGGRLLMPHMYEGAPPPALPSPEALRGKVLVKAKK